MKSRRRIRFPKFVRVLLLLLGAVLGWWAAGWMQLQTLSAQADTLPPQRGPASRPASISQSASIETLPAARGGQDLVGKRMPELRFSRWLQTPNAQPVNVRGKVTLYRWWTEACPYCLTTLPAVETLRSKYGGLGLQVVAVYHPKPRGAISDKQILDAAAERHYRGAIAIDEDWASLEKAWLSSGDRDATSVSFLVDEDGTIRFVHPGVAYFPSTDPKKAQENADFRLLDTAIAHLLNVVP